MLLTTVISIRTVTGTGQRSAFMEELEFLQQSVSYRTANRIVVTEKHL